MSWSRRARPTSGATTRSVPSARRSPGSKGRCGWRSSRPGCRIVAAVAAERGAVEDDVWQEYVSQNSLGRLPTADELAWAVEMLLDPEAGILHGSVLYLDAGGHRGIH